MIELNTYLFSSSLQNTSQKDILNSYQRTLSSEPSYKMMCQSNMLEDAVYSEAHYGVCPSN